MDAAPEGESDPAAAAPPAPPPLLITADMLAPDPHAGKRDFERGMSLAPAATLALVAVNVLVFAWQLSTGALESEERLLAAGALEGTAVGRGEVWRLGTSMFLHGGFDHLIGNCIALYILGMAAEHAFGWRRMLPAYLAAGLAGSVASVLVEPRPTVGASGAIFGLMGLLIVMLRRNRDRLFVRDGRIGVVLLAWAAWSVATGFLDPAIANFAHLGGFAAGALAGLVIRPPLLDHDGQAEAA